MAVTILDIAKATGKTYSTVSRALNNCGRMNEATRKLILETAERLGYRPNFAGVALQKGRTNTIGVLLPELGNPFYAKLLHYLKQTLAAQGYDIAVYDYEYDREQERHLLEKMYKGSCDGVYAVLSSLEYTGDLVERLWKAHVPVVLCGTPSLPGEAVYYDYVSIERNEAVTEVFNYLAGQKKRHVVMTELFITEAISQMCRGGIQKLYQKAKSPFTLDFYTVTLENGAAVRTGYSVFQEIMNQYPETDVIIARNGMEVYGMLAAARQQGIRVPEDLVFISCDNTWLTQYSSIPIIAFDQQVQLLAEHGADMLLRRISASAWEAVECFIAKATVIFPQH